MSMIVSKKARARDNSILYKNIECVLEHYGYLIAPVPSRLVVPAPTIIGMYRIPIDIVRIIASYSVESIPNTILKFMFILSLSGPGGQKMTENEFKSRYWYYMFKYWTPGITWFTNIPIYLTRRDEVCDFTRSSDSQSEYNDKFDLWPMLKYISTGQKINPMHLAVLPWPVAMFMHTYQLRS